ncbi:hypothetical protein DNX69_15605 [Rhodopseudomonas palustris]|uniref:Uncharacterized protein n=1 Tax=Rhodopseudomonas palustris TaxID=1076 RepID=A0A323UD31_RHOPL|nr:hypothetical protein [Rhodopseudomonas palustris]PZA10772.1 hypothetical protein DNX69_15605 [Rhodopseudomonas palustris]
MAAAAAIVSVAGCGTYVPPIQEYGEGTPVNSDFSAGGAFEFAIKSKVYCDIVDAVVASRKAGVLPGGWAVQTTLDLQVDESGALNPGATYLSSPTFTIGAGAVLSSQATRESKFGNYWALDKLKGASSSPCSSSNARASSLLLSDLGISDWLENALRSRYYLPSSGGNKKDSIFKEDFLSYHIKFVVTTSGTVTPAWKLVRVTTGNGGLPLVGAGRIRTHDLLLTFGPTFSANSPNLAISSHAAQDFGNAVSNSRRQLPQ